jgi:purine nucleoside permease
LFIKGSYFAAGGVAGLTPATGAAAGGESWLKYVVATKVAMMLSLGAYT